MVPGGVQNPGGSAEAPIDRAECRTRLQLVHCHFGLRQERERAGVIPSFTLKVDKSIALEAASGIDPW